MKERYKNGVPQMGPTREPGKNPRPIPHGRKVVLEEKKTNPDTNPDINPKGTTVRKHAPRNRYPSQLELARNVAGK